MAKREPDRAAAGPAALAFPGVAAASPRKGPACARFHFPTSATYFARGGRRGCDPASFSPVSSCENVTGGGRCAAAFRVLAACPRSPCLPREVTVSPVPLFFSLHTHLSTSCVRSRRTVNFALPEAAHTFAPFLPQPVAIPSPPSPCISREKQIFARGQWPRSSPTREQLGSAHWKRAAVVTFREEQLTRPAHLAAGAAAACEALFGSVSRCLGRVSFSFFRLAGVLRSPPPLRGGERRPPASIGVRRGQL